MTPTMDKIWIIDESRLGETFMEAYKKGQAVIHDGVAYWASGSGKTGIIEHLPFKEAAFKTVEQALQAAQVTTVVATAISTTIILGAIIAQTKYLSNKIEKLQEVADLISKDLHSNNLLFYIDQVTSYYGDLETARLLLRERTSVHEIKEIATSAIPQLISKRNRVLFLLDNIIKMADADQLSNRHLDLVLNFAQLILDLTPKGIHLEYLLSARTGRISLSETILIDGSEKYNVALTTYKNHLNKMHKSILHGTIGDKLEIFQKIEKNAVELFSSNHNKLLLSLPTGRVAISA